MSALCPQLLVSDNASGVHPEVMAKLNAINSGHALAYGHDPLSEEMQGCFQQLFGDQVQVWPVCTGTAANVLALTGMMRSHETVYCAEEAHLLVDECGAPEHYIGCKLVALPGVRGKLTLPALRERILADRGVVHRSQPRVISLAEATERGTVYQLEELRAIAALAQQFGLLVHMDGARLANAAVALGVELVDIVRAADVGVLSFGGTKNGLMMAEALVVLNPALQSAFPYIRKQGMQLASKQRFVAAQFLAYFEGALWRRNAEAANAMARYLAGRLEAFPEVRLTVPVETNMVFAEVPNDWLEALSACTPFLIWPGEQTSEIRLVTSFDTTRAFIDHFIQQVGRLAGREAEP